MSNIVNLFEEDLIAVNVGLPSFAENLEHAGATAIHLDWQPPAAGDVELGRKLALMTYQADLRQEIARANQQAVDNIISARPVLIDIQAAKEALGLEENQFLHSGPPIDFAHMCGPMQGAAIGAMIFEGLAETHDQARKKLEAGEIIFSPCHQYRAVGPMAGLISPSMPVFVVKNEEAGNMSFSNINEGLGKVLRFGAFSPEVIDRLKWMSDTLAPALKQVVSEDNPIDLRAITAQALQMGDECHNRNVAATSLLFKQIVNRFLRSDVDLKSLQDVIIFISANDHFFLNLSMACCKAMVDSAAGIPKSTIITAMSRNGVEFGIRLSSTEDEWFTAPAELPDGLYFPGYSEEDAALDLGDSSITETAGIGGFTMAAAPAIVGFVGGSATDALNYTREMQEITVSRNTNYSLPSLDYTGAPVGIDAQQVLSKNIAPIINTGIAHKEAGIGQIGAGIVRAPLDCFKGAMNKFLIEVL